MVCLALLFQLTRVLVEQIFYLLRTPLFEPRYGAVIRYRLISKQPDEVYMLPTGFFYLSCSVDVVLI